MSAKYGHIFEGLGEPGHSLDERVAWQHTVARGMFLVDRGHRTVAFLFRGGRPVRIMGLDAEDDQSKYLMMDMVARQVGADEADEVIVTAEVWAAPYVGPGDERFGLRARDRADKIEELITYGLDRHGSLAAVASDIERDGDSVRLTEARRSKSMVPQTLLPVWRAWHGVAAPPPWATPSQDVDI